MGVKRAAEKFSSTRESFIDAPVETIILAARPPFSRGFSTFRVLTREVEQLPHEMLRSSDNKGPISQFVLATVHASYDFAPSRLQGHSRSDSNVIVSIFPWGVEILMRREPIV